MLMTFFVIFSNSKIYAQALKTKFNAGIESYLSGNGHGTFFGGYVGIDKGRSSISIGPSLQKRSLKVNSGKLSYSYILAGYKKTQQKLNMFDQVKENLAELDSLKLESMAEEEHNSRLQLRFYSYLQYTHNALLSDNTELRDEKPYTGTHNNENLNNWNQIRISTAELGIGAELQIKLTNKLYWKNTIAVSGYYHLNCPVNRCNAISPVMITIGTGFNFPNL